MPRAIKRGACRYGTFCWYEREGPIGWSMEVFGEWAQLEVEFMRQFVPDRGVAIDVGAHIGTHTVALSQFVGDKGRVYALEPHPGIYCLLHENVRQNAGNVVVFPVAAGDARGVSLMPAIPEDGWYNCGASGLMASEGIEVEVDTLDNLVPEPAHFVKIDAEGTEVSVLRGFAEGLKNAPVLLMEANTVVDAWRIFEHLQEFDYRAYMCSFRAFNERNHRNRQHNEFGMAEESSMLFVPPGRPEPRALTSSMLIPVGNLDEITDAISKVLRYVQTS